MSMKHILIASILLAGVLSAKDKSSTYQVGVYGGSEAARDGTMTNDINCGRSMGSTVCSGGARLNQVTIYQIQVDGGFWTVETLRQARDTNSRRIFKSEPLHFSAEAENPLDLLKLGDRVLFRIERHKKLIGVEIDIFIPFADNPAKEAKFVGSLTMTSETEKTPARPSDNVRAACEAHLMSPELEKQICGR